MAKVKKPASSPELRDKIKMTNEMIGYELIVFLSAESRTDKKSKGAPKAIRIEVIDQVKESLLKRFEPMYRNLSHFKVARWTYAEKYAILIQGRNKAVPATSRRQFNDRFKFGHDNASLESEVLNKTQADFSAPRTAFKKR